MYWDLSLRFNDILSSLNEKERRFLSWVYDFAYDAHLGQKRKSWEDYFIHPLAVSIKLHNKFNDSQLTCAGLLHDTVEDNPEIYIKDIYLNFWFEIWYLVDSVTKNKQKYYWEEFIFERKIDKFLFWWMNNIKCFLLKLADRDDNMKTLANLKDNKQVRMAFETQAIFSPLEEIIWFHTINSIEEWNNNLRNHCNERKLNNYLELKDYLINKTFRNFSNESFDTVYKNTANVSWKITDRDTFITFLKIPNIDDKIDIETIQINENWKFLAIIKFKKWEIIDKDITLEISDTYSF
jgi:(p)ppGpp synthase/HD superfamily hydrolase